MSVSYSTSRSKYNFIWNVSQRMRLGSFKITVTELPLKWILEFLRWTQATKYHFKNGLMALGSLSSPSLGKLRSRCARWGLAWKKHKKIEVSAKEVSWLILTALLWLHAQWFNFSLACSPLFSMQCEIQLCMLTEGKVNLPISTINDWYCSYCALETLDFALF